MQAASVASDGSSRSESARSRTPQANLPKASTNGRKRLAFDHHQLLDAAIARLRGKAEYTSLPAFLLSPGFTLPELQQAYETVLGRPLDRSAFRKRMLDGGFLLESGPASGSPGRPAMTYRLRDVATPAAFPRTFRSGE